MALPGTINVLPYLLAQAITTGAFMVLNFVMNKFRPFRNHKPADNRAEQARHEAFSRAGSVGAGSGNRTRVFSLEGCCSTIELYPRPFGSLFFPHGRRKN